MILQVLQTYSTKDIKVEGADMGYRDFLTFLRNLQRVSPLQVGQTTELINVRDGVHVLKLLNAKQVIKKRLWTI
jgi:peptidyl-prolyl cis-trans isomerase SurA